MKKNNLIWFDIKELEHRLQNNEISDKVIFKYLLIYAIFFVIYSSYGGNSSLPVLNNSLLIIIDMVMIITIMIIGVKMTFNINSAGDNRDYFRRFLSLSFVTGIRLNVFLLIPVLLFATFLNLDDSAGFNKNAMSIVFMGLNLIIVILYFFMLTNSFRRVCK